MGSMLRCALIVAMSVLACGVSIGSETTKAQLASAAKATPIERYVLALVIARNSAIRAAFGELFENSSGDIRIEFASPSQPFYPTEGATAYDAKSNVLVFRRMLPLGEFGAALPKWVYSYWPYYESSTLRTAAPIVEIVDGALWNAHMLESAEQRGLSWPHEGCTSLDLSQRLGCEMLVSAVFETLRPHARVFNSNRLDRIWPQDLRELQGRAWQRDDPDYRDVRRFGGVVLIQPLVREFGVSRVFAYVAQAPFRIENDNVHTSALRYQEQARNALAH
jgi:hypothetical protein